MKAEECQHIGDVWMCRRPSGHTGEHYLEKRTDADVPDWVARQLFDVTVRGQFLEEYTKDAITLAQQEARAAALEEAAARCDALSTSPMGNSYGNLGNAYDDAASEIRALLEGK